MQILISDANVLIDMEAGGLLELMFKLPNTAYLFEESPIIPFKLFAFEQLIHIHTSEIPSFRLLLTTTKLFLIKR